MKNIELSIIVPVYNSEKYIPKTIDKLLQVNCLKEIIVIDSNSTDNSSILLKKYQDKIKLITLDDNKGVSYARNLGIAKSHGKYIAFMDIDDDIELNMYEKMLAKITSTDSDVCVCNYDEFYENKTIKNKSKYNYEFAEEILKNYLIDKISPAVWDKIYKREFLKDIRFNENLSIGEDILFILEVFIKTNKVTFVNEYLYHYFQQDKSVMHKLSPRHLEFEQVVASLDISKKKILEEKYPEEFEFFCLEMTTRAIHSISGLAVKNNKQEAKSYLKQIITNEKLKSILKNNYFSKSIKLEMRILKIFGLNIHLMLTPTYKKLRNLLRK